MKRLLSVLLAVLMLCGVGMVSASAGGGIDPEAYRESAMGRSYNIFNEEWVGHEKIVVGALLPGKDINDFYIEYNDANDASWLQMNGEITVWERFALRDAILPKYFSSSFVDEFKAWQAALVNHSVAIAEFLVPLRGIYAGGEYFPDYWNELGEQYKDKYDAFRTNDMELYQAPFENGELSLAQATIILQGLESDIRALIKEINDIMSSEPEPKDKILELFTGFLPEGLANVLAVIVRYVFFGWLWGRWL